MDVKYMFGQTDRAKHVIVLYVSFTSLLSVCILFYDI